MSKWIKKEEGITLIELLASLALLSVVIILIGSIHIFGQKQFSSQTEANSQANDLRNTLAMISREARSADNFIIENTDTLIINNEDKFHRDNTDLKKNETVLSSRVQFFRVKRFEETNRIEITLRSTPNQLNQTEEYKTTIYLRDAVYGGDME